MWVARNGIFQLFHLITHHVCVYIWLRILVEAISSTGKSLSFICRLFRDVGIYTYKYNLPIVCCLVDFKSPGKNTEKLLLLCDMSQWITKQYGWYYTYTYFSPEKIRICSSISIYVCISIEKRYPRHKLKEIQIELSW